MEAYFHLLPAILDIFAKDVYYHIYMSNRFCSFMYRTLKSCFKHCPLCWEMCQIWGLSDLSHKGMKRPSTEVSLDGQGSPHQGHDCNSRKLALMCHLVAALNWECENPWLHLGQQGMWQEYFAVYSLREETSSVSDWVRNYLIKNRNLG